MKLDVTDAKAVGEAVADIQKRFGEVTILVNKAGITRMAFTLDKDGYIGLPPGPGLGVEVDEKKLEEEAKKPQTYKWPGAKLKDGSVSDY